MPTNTFFHLPKEKQNRLIHAIRQEFSRVPFEQISINQIIHNANISRGSFYQYFYNKQDLLQLILHNYQQQLLTYAKKSLILHHGDIFNMFEDILNFTVHFAKDETNQKIYQNLFSDIRINRDCFLKLYKDNTQQKINEELLPYIDFTALNLNEHDDLIYFIDILAAICKETIAEIFLNLPNYQNTYKNCQKKLQLLKQNFTKIKESKIDA